MKYKNFFKLISLIAAFLLIAGCGKKEEQNKPEQKAAEVAETFEDVPQEQEQAQPQKPEGPFLKTEVKTENLSKNSVLFATVEIEKKFENPFDSSDIALDATITCGSQSYVWPLYFTGKKGDISYWTLKCPLLHSGASKVQFNLKAKDGFQDSEEISFTVANSDISSGVYKTAKTSNFALFDENSAAFRGIGANIILGSNANEAISQIKTLAENGCNIARISFADFWSFFNMGKPVADAASDLAYEVKDGYFNKDAFHSLDRLFDAAKNNNVKLIISFLNDDSFKGQNYIASFPAKTAKDIKQFMQSEASKAYFKDFIRYFVARYGCQKEFLAWNLYSAIDKYSLKDIEGKIMWLDEVTNTIKEIDITQRMNLSTAATSSVLDSLWAGEYSAMVALESKNMRDYAFAVNEQCEFFAKKYAKPAFFASLGLDKNKSGHLDLKMMHFHDALWGGFMSQCPILPMPDDYQTLVKREAFYNYKSVKAFADLAKLDYSKMQSLRLKGVVLFQRRGENKLEVLPVFGATHPEIMTDENLNVAEINNGVLVKNTLAGRLTDNCPMVVNIDKNTAAGTITFNINAVKKSDKPFELSFMVDDVLAATKTINPANYANATVLPDEDAQKIMCAEKVSFKFPAGKHKLSLEVKSQDWQNPSYADIASIEFVGIGSASGVNQVSVLGAKSGTKTVLWFKRAGTNSWGFFKYGLHKKTIPDLKPFEYAIENLDANSEYRIVWFDSYLGKEIVSGVLKTDNAGTLKLRTAAFKYDIACFIEKKN